jgi:hypothetical protein
LLIKLKSTGVGVGIPKVGPEERRKLRWIYKMGVLTGVFFTRR